MGVIGDKSRGEVLLIMIEDSDIRLLQFLSR